MIFKNQISQKRAAADGYRTPKRKTLVETGGQERFRNTQWCECMNCDSMPTDQKCYCCYGRILVTVQLQDVSESEDTGDSHTDCITHQTDFPALSTPRVL